MTIKSPYAIICPNHGQVLLLSEQQYDYQLDLPDDMWECPICGEISEWDYDHYGPL